MARRSRKRREDGAGAARSEAATGNVREGGAARPPAPREAMARGYARGREKDEAVRAALQPLAPGERPWPLTASAALAALFAAANLILLAVGWEIDGDEQPVGGTLIFAGVMLAAAIGLWQRRYWAVLGFEVLLGVTLLGAMLAVLRAGNLAAVALCFAVMAVAGPLFWKLIRVMARIQLPPRPAERPRPPVS